RARGYRAAAVSDRPPEPAEPTDSGEAAEPADATQIPDARGAAGPEVGNGRLGAHAILAKLSWALRSEPGDVRPHNEDFAGAFAPTIPDDAWDRGPLFVLADGLGGHAAGEVASRGAVEAALNAWTNGAPAAPHQALRAAVRAANVAVFDAALEAGRRGMASTVTALTLAGRQAIVAHVGDSRCYLVRGGTCSQLTNDHSRVGEMLRAGLLTPEQAAVHPARSMITRTVGSEPSVQVDLIRHDTEAGDIFVLCSDGLWDVVARHDIAEVAGAVGGADVPTVAEAAERLIDLALARHTPDNVTVLVVRVTTDRPVPAAGARRGLFRRGPR
ncbi:MAG TPA: protein phosphatase 2C domain-containing protein, partial [Acidimicrobiales bacterium]|nr:protein phosphatase 2C domain-containing protein [Acidimicrobiales bacterium]